MSATARLEHCSFRKETGTLVLASEFFAGGFPEEVDITSHHTGVTVRFRKDVEAGIANEFWDGEMCEYIPVDPTNNCRKLVVHHEY